MSVSQGHSSFNGGLAKIDRLPTYVCRQIGARERWNACVRIRRTRCAPLMTLSRSGGKVVDPRQSC